MYVQLKDRVMENLHGTKLCALTMMNRLNMHRRGTSQQLECEKKKGVRRYGDSSSDSSSSDNTTEACHSAH